MEILVTGLLLGGTYALIALGLTLQYGVARIMNLSTGETLVAGCFAAWLLFTAAGIAARRGHLEARGDDRFQTFEEGRGDTGQHIEPAQRRDQPAQRIERQRRHMADHRPADDRVAGPQQRRQRQQQGQAW